MLLRLLLIAFTLNCIYTVQADNDLETIRQRFVAELMESKVDAAEIKSILETQQEDGSWPDINYEDVSRTGFEHAGHLARMTTLSRAFKQKGNTYFETRPVHKAINAALNFWLANDFICDNWWWNQIGTPNHLVSTFLIFDDELTTDQKAQADHIIKRGNVHAWGARPGGDRIKIAAIQGKYALFLRDRKMLDEAVEVIVSEIKTSTGRGLKADMGFHHRHDRVNNTLSYGTSYANSFADWADKVGGTRYHFPDEALQMLIDFYLDGICQSMVYGKYPDPGAKNRSISRKNTLHAWNADIPRKLRKVSDYRSDELEAIIDIREGKIKPDLSGNRFYWHSEYFSHQRPHFFTSARMHSRRNHTMEEPYNEEGLQNHHLGDGSNFISRTGEEYYNIFPVFDWQKIPGTTVVQKPELPDPSQIQQRGLSGFVGGVSDGTYGAAAFDFISPLDPLQVKKAWFMFDREYVCLGAGLQARTKYPVVTTINQVHLRTTIEVSHGAAVTEVPRGTHVLDSVNWLLQDSIGYLFHEPTNVHLQNTTVTGSWRSINHQSGYTDEPVKQEVFKLWLDHGARPQGAAYAYTIVPGADREQIAAYARQPQIEVLSNTADLQAVWHQGLSMAQVIFHKYGTIVLPNGQQLSLDSPGIVMAYFSGAHLISLWVSDPSRTLGKLHIGLRSGHSDPVRTIAVDLPQGENAGKSIQVGI